MSLLKRKRSFGSAELWELARTAGYAKPTLLQSKVVPLIMKGRDVAVEVEGDSGKTAAFILPVIARIKRGRAGIKAVVITSSAEDSRKVFREFQRFARSGKRFSLFGLGFEENERSEHRGLSKNPDVVIGTPSKIIDHIRRGNLDFSVLQTVVIDKKGENPGFADDLRFIFSKLPQKKQIILFASAFGPDTEALTALLKRPLLAPLSAWKDTTARLTEMFVEVSENHKERALTALVLTEPAEALLVQCAEPKTAQKLAGRLKELGFKAAALHEDIPAGEQGQICESFGVGVINILVSTFAAARSRNLRWVTGVLNLDLPLAADSYKPRSFVLQKVVTVGTEEQYLRLQEMIKVRPEKTNLPSDDQVLAGAVQQMVKRFRSEEDPKELNRYRRIIRKNVPLALRSYLTAYLFKSALGSEKPEKRTPGKFARLFVSVGKNRRVYAKDLAGWFMKSLQADRSQVGDIRVLDNYSFVEIDAQLAEKAIARLSGTELKGKQISVNYARKKEDE